MEMQETSHTNSLIHESSPYLLQHAHNPVDWLPWGEAAFEKSRGENKPLFLSIGYAACHWCHVMEQESFKDDIVARILNDHFVPVKVDREERPDVDEVYMTAVQMLTGSGGWPLSVFLTPELKPFFGGTYFPPAERHGLPSFRRVLHEVARAWQDRQAEVQASARSMYSVLQATLYPPVGQGAAGSGAGLTDAELAAAALKRLQTNYDSEDGGFGGAPKFPPAGSLLFLLRSPGAPEDAQSLEMVHTTLHRMAWGGIYDQVGGGFHRYAVDREWLVPHFEKMLYDNALLSQAYVEAWQRTRQPLYRRVAAETLDFVAREMRDPCGTFHSSLDADSDGREGKYYLWTQAEIESLLGKEDAALFCGSHGVTPGGNFEGENILHLSVDLSTFALQCEIDEPELAQRLDAMRRKLLEARCARKMPGVDDKAVTAWNGLMISAFARAYQAMGRPHDLQTALAAGFFFRGSFEQHRRLFHVFRHGKGKIGGFLDDYAAVGAAMLDLYETTFDTGWIEAAEKILSQMLEKFRDPETGLLSFAAPDHADLPARTRSHADGPTPAGSATAAAALLRAASLLDRPAFSAAAEDILRDARPLMREHTAAFSAMLCAMGFAERKVELALVGPFDAPETAAMLQAIRSVYLPDKVVAFLDPSDVTAERCRSLMPILRERPMAANRPTVYVCRNRECRNPMTSASELGILLQHLSAKG